jgi:hypothetical protein
MIYDQRWRPVIVFPRDGFELLAHMVAQVFVELVAVLYAVYQFRQPLQEEMPIGGARRLRYQERCVRIARRTQFVNCGVVHCGVREIAPQNRHCIAEFFFISE